MLHKYVASGTVMNCRKVERLIHRMLDGDLEPRQEDAVKAHLAECERCDQYYREMAALSKAAHLPDPDMPSDFRRNWQQALTSSRRARVQRRSSKMLPALACGIACVVVLSTVLVNPQAFGLGGEKLRSESGELTPTSESAEPSVHASAPIVFDDVVIPSRVPKPATQNAEYWEETVWSSASPSQVVTGDIEPPEEETAAEVEASPEQSVSIDVLELIAPGAATVAAMKSFAEDIDGMSVHEADGLYLESTPENIELFLTAFACEGPQGTTRLHIVCEESAE